MNRRAFKGLGVYMLLLLIGLAIYYMVVNREKDVYKDYDNEKLMKDVQNGNIDEIEIAQNKEVPTGKVYVSYVDGSEVIYYTSDVNETYKSIKEIVGNNIKVKLDDVEKPSLFQKFAPYIFALFLALIVLFIIMGQNAANVAASNGGNKYMNFGKSRAKKDIDTGLTFKDVAGMTEEKEELTEIVDFLKDPTKYAEMGARIPKGVLLVGPPGTGKTLLAKAVAGEAEVPFFSISGSDFVEMFVGVGASRVRDLFADAKRNSPCMIFIDEIDAVARRRGTGLGGGHDEREQTLNQLLVEMDGFGVNEGIIVLAATNRVDILDPAIMRPGRFDRKVAVNNPDIKGREEIIKVHTRNKKLSEDVNIHEIARTTVGFSGADLENLMNEAAIRATKLERKFITKEDIDKSFIKVGVGTEKKSKLISEVDKKITAYHETGHAILFHELSEVGPVHLVSIIPTGPSAAGYTMPLPENENSHVTRKKMLQNIMVEFGGRIAEELIFDDITTGASHDIKMATQAARDMVIKYGFSEKIGPVNYETNDEGEVFLGRDLGHARMFGEVVASEIDAEVKRIIDDCYKAAKSIIMNNMEVLHKGAELLLEKEKITGEEFDKLF
ncbi:ATP-dependent zinc metalloprotease FtsH [Eubacterium ruminantium]|uniref:ATP-dependent zinc metalloprotease FtsH n=1 Tax=Eubacterium ruminantium TaxID=42322 RepID=UPI00247A1608|nr:ATP-dependent zinc metalloprotease FtsH [Eubacterium ruminantium]